MEIYDPPPIPEGVSPDTAYMAQVYASGTRAILREGARRHEELMRAHTVAEGSGLGGWIASQLGRLPAPVQTSMALALGLGMYQCFGEILSRATGQQLPPLNVPSIAAEAIAPDGG